MCVTPDDAVIRILVCKATGPLMALDIMTKWSLNIKATLLANLPLNDEHVQIHCKIHLIEIGQSVLSLELY